MRVDELYTRTPFEEIITIDSIVTIHYFEFASDYVFKGEEHNFWEFLYVDKGEVEIMADIKGYKLEQGDIVFHKPNEFHSVWANGRTAPNIVVISFQCNSKAMGFFENKILKLPAQGRDWLAEIVRESGNAYENKLDDGYRKLIRKKNPPAGSEQLIKLYLELLLIHLMRGDNSAKNKDRLYSPARERAEGDIVNNIIDFMNENVHRNLAFDDICIKFYMGRTMLKTIFKSVTGQGVMEYFRMLKMEEAKRLIREGRHNFTEISQMLGYESVHYFSRCFKKYMNMSPTEYSVSVMARAQI